MAEIKLVRVDYRLIHGQVVARWLKVCPVRRIVLVDDVLGNDEFMSDIYKMAVPLLFLPVFIINMVGQDVVVNVMNSLPQFVTHGLEVAGGVLPALGFALIMNMIGKNKLIPFVFLGYIVVSVGGVNSLTAGIIAVSILLSFVGIF